MDERVYNPLALGAPSVGLVFYNVDSKGGMERQASQLAPRLARLGHRVVCVSTITPRRYGTNETRLEGVEVHRVPVTRTPFFEEAARALFARSGGVDVIYAVHYRCGLHAARIARATATPVVCKLACSGEHGDVRVMGSARLAEMRTVDRYVCMTEALRDEAIAHGLEAGKIVSIPNGVDLAAFAGERREEPGRVLFVGRLNRQKRVDVLLRAIANVKGARLDVAGEGEEEPSLRALARELAVEDRVAFLGPRSDVADLQARAQVFVLPSESEGLPNALLEALAAGTPSVATDIPGNRDVATHEKEALLVPAGDAPALAGAISRLLEDRGLASSLGQAGRERARSFDFDEVARAYSRLFTELARPATWRLGIKGRAVLAARAAARVLCAE
ncbi:MAG TPA: glycosyltransferase [Planctomycetota bacterium]|nr:glycosyltransferase [Planctomycetota bacterium]